jgi:carboxyl-terminal processing protease
MKKSILLIIILLTFKISFSQNEITENQKTESLIYIWGLLKYKHPKVSKGDFDIDKEFISVFDKMKSIHTRNEFNLELFNWIKKFESKKIKYKTNTNFLETKRLFKKSADFSWIKNSFFDHELIELLNKIKDNYNYGDYYASVNKMSSAVEFKNDKNFINFNKKRKSHRALFLASFWNKMKYWNVNIYLTETNWNKVLTELVPEFLSDDETTYSLGKDKLFAKLNDSHSNYNSSYLFKNKKNKFSLYGGRIVNDTLVIRTLFNESLAKKENIELGDLIFSIDGKNLKQYYIDKFSNRISASNENYLKAILEPYYLLSNNSDSLKIGLMKKNKTVLKKYIKLYKYSDYKYKPVTLNIIGEEKWKTITQDVGYINLKEINKSELKKAFKTFNQKKGLIIDLRNYPKNLNKSDVPNFIFPKKKVFMKLLAPFTPSYGKYEQQSKLKLLYNPFSAGKKNKNYYKGKIVLLVDRNTGSMAEYFGMAIQQAPNCITLGEQTFGAVMNRKEVILKDNTKIDFTGAGAFYPNNENVQRNGLKIDFVIKEIALNYNENKYIEEAIKIIEGK